MFVFWRLHLYPAAQEPVLELLELRQFLPNPGFNSLYRMSVAKFDL